MRKSTDFQRVAAVLILSIATCGCANPVSPTDRSTERAGRLQVLREPERERVARLTQEIARLRSDLEATETVLSEAEAGLARDHSRADAVSSLATTRIEIDRAISLAPWREAAIEAARNKLDEAELQIADGHFGVALFFVHRARHVAETIRDEAVFVARNGRVRFIRGTGIILRAGPSTDDPLLAQLTPESIVIPGVDKKASGYA